ncbi:hypothetical protein [Halomicrobium sp. LC1Hm]|nr:hypothetical protein [Halomicrobium sp. LC1Hm]
MSEFVRASRLYDAEAGEPLHFEWATVQRFSETHEAVDRYTGGQ